MIEVRAMLLDDAEVVKTLAGQLGYERTAAEVRAWLMGMDERTEAAFVACRGDEVVGWIQMEVARHLVEDRYGLIAGLVVKDGLRGDGIGRLLCERGERWSRERGFKSVRVSSRVVRERAHRFYRKLGFVDVKTSLMLQKTCGVTPAAGG